MTMNNLVKSLPAALIVLLLGSPPVLAKTLEGIPLVWKPTSQIGEAGAVDLTGLSETRIQVKGLTDGREGAALIGENREDDKVKRVTTRDSVAEWTSGQFRMLLDQFGLNVVDGEADVTISGEIKRFFVTEVDTYEGDVGLKIEVRGRNGKLLWTGMTGGAANRFGRSYKAENYYEVLSDSFLDAVQNLFKNDGFRSALKH